jgi:hypothetical protein
MTKGMIDNYDFRRLNVKIEFLQPCNATTILDATNEKPLSKMENDILVGLLIAIAAEKTGSEKESAKITAELIRKYPDDYQRIVTDILVPKFRCDYRVKVFATFFYADGHEIETDGDIPIALRIRENQRKEEMLPGETTYVTFLIPDKAVSWEVWVPK